MTGTETWDRFLSLSASQSGEHFKALSEGGTCNSPNQIAADIPYTLELDLLFNLFIL